MPPKRSRCSATARTQSSSEPMFAVTACAPSSAAAASIFSRVRDASVTSYPSSRSIRAIAKPIPEEPPVTSALGMAANGRGDVRPEENHRYQYDVPSPHGDGSRAVAVVYGEA